MFSGRRSYRLQRNSVKILIVYEALIKNHSRSYASINKLYILCCVYSSTVIIIKVFFINYNMFKVNITQSGSGIFHVYECIIFKLVLFSLISKLHIYLHTSIK